MWECLFACAHGACPLSCVGGVPSDVTGAGVGSPPAVRSPVASAARAICFALRLGSTTLSRVGRPPARDAVTALGPRDRAEPARPCVAVERQRDRAALCISRARRTPPVALPLTRLDKMVLSKPIYFTLRYLISYRIKRRSRVARACVKPNLAVQLSDFLSSLTKTAFYKIRY